MRKLVVLLVILVLANGCSSPPSPTEGPTGEAASPLVSPLPNPTLPPLPPTPSSLDVGTVVGVMLQGSRSSSEPVEGVILALGTVLTLSDGTPAMARLNRQEAPRTQSDADGSFVFTDVPPGQYSLFVDLINRAVALRDPDTGGDFYVEVNAGEVTDLGDMVYSSLPTP
jgi:hypothetical protein